MTDFEFLRPHLLWLLVPFLCYVVWKIRQERHHSIWAKVCSKDLLPHLLDKKGKRQWLPFLLILSSGSLLLTALAGPSWETISAPLVRAQTGLVIALDLTSRMDAQDVKPSRLQRAIFKIKDLLEFRREGQTALIVYSEEPFIVTPLTEDIAAIKALLPALETRIMPVAGHRADKAVAKAADMLKQASISNGAVLLITPELTREERDKSIEIANREHLTVSLLGVGTEQGAPIPKPGGGFVNDEKGSPLISALIKENLVQVANSTKGTFSPLSIDESDLTSIVKAINPIKSGNLKDETEANQNKRHDQGYLLVLAALPLVALFFRRGMFAIALLFVPHSLSALSWDDCWWTADQQGARFYQEESYQNATEAFENRDWKGASFYRTGDFERSAELFKENLTADGYYNHGTAKAKLGDLDAALEAYKKALEIQPDHEDALYNKKIIEEFKEKQDKQEQQQQDQKQDKQDQQKQDQKQDKQDQQQQDQKQDQQKSDQSKQEKSNEGNQGEDKSQKGEKQQEQKGSEKEDKQEQQQSKESESEQDREQKESFQKEIDQKLKEAQECNEKEEKEIGVEELPEDDPQRQNDDRMLQRIKDDPCGLLRRKFLMQYRRDHE